MEKQVRNYPEVIQEQGNDEIQVPHFGVLTGRVSEKGNGFSISDLNPPPISVIAPYPVKFIFLLGVGKGNFLIGCQDKNIRQDVCQFFLFLVLFRS